MDGYGLSTGDDLLPLSGKWYTEVFTAPLLGDQTGPRDLLVLLHLLED